MALVWVSLKKAGKERLQFDNFRLLAILCHVASTFSLCFRTQEVISWIVSLFQCFTPLPSYRHASGPPTSLCRSVNTSTARKWPVAHASALRHFHPFFFFLSPLRTSRHVRNFCLLLFNLWWWNAAFFFFFLNLSANKLNETESFQLHLTLPTWWPPRKRLTQLWRLFLRD